MNGYGGPQLAAAFRTVRANTIQIAQDIPEDKYGFAPVPGWRTVGSLLTHISQMYKLQKDLHATKRVTTVDGYDFPAFIRGLLGEEATPRTKAEIIALLESEGETCAAWLESLSPEFLGETFGGHGGAFQRSRFEAMLSIKEHEMHHRGQLMLIERMLGITPHLTRQSMERMAARS
jgi:uncharacterized damage-inducible protein DinB